MSKTKLVMIFIFILRRTERPGLLVRSVFVLAATFFVLCCYYLFRWLTKAGLLVSMLRTSQREVLLTLANSVTPTFNGRNIIRLACTM